MAKAQVFEEPQVSRSRDKAVPPEMRGTRAAGLQLHMNMSAAGAAAAAMEATFPELQHTDPAHSAQLLQAAVVGSQKKFGLNYFLGSWTWLGNRIRQRNSVAGLIAFVVLIAAACVAGFAYIFGKNLDDTVSPTSGMHKPQLQHWQQQQQTTLRQPQTLGSSKSPGSKRSSQNASRNVSGVFAPSVPQIPPDSISAWTLTQAETQEAHRGGMTGFASVNHAGRLCRELLVPKNCESSLLMPRPFPPVGELQGRIAIEGVTQSPLYHATYYLRPRQSEHSNELQLEHPPTRLVLASAIDDFVYASCVDARSKATSQNGPGLLVQDEKGRNFGTLSPKGCSENYGFTLKTHTEFQASWVGDMTAGKLNCVDQHGALLAVTDNHGQSQRVIRIGHGANVGVIMLSLLGIELLRHDMRSTSTPM